LCCLFFFLWPLCCLFFFFWSLCCLFFFDLRILIAPVVSSNSSYLEYDRLLTLKLLFSIQGFNVRTSWHYDVNTISNMRGGVLLMIK
jgi:hypothetical protein